MGLSSDPRKAEKQLLGLIKGAETSGSTKAKATLEKRLEEVREKIASLGSSDDDSQGTSPGSSEGEGSPSARAVDRLEYSSSRGARGRPAKKTKRAGRTAGQGKERARAKAREPEPESPEVGVRPVGFLEGLIEPFRRGGNYTRER